MKTTALIALLALPLSAQTVNPDRPGACPKCGGINAVTMFVPTGVVYTVDRAWGFKPYRPADLSEDGMSVQATEDHILHSCPCGWKWVEPCKDAPVEVM